MDPQAFRARFPVLAHTAYLNAGTNGPLPVGAVDAAVQRLHLELERGRSGPEHFLQVATLVEHLRGRLAALIGAGADEVAITRSTTEAINIALAGLELASGDELLTSDEEHPGLLAPLAALARRSGAVVRIAPFARVAEHAGKHTRLIALSHVSWMSGAVAPIAELRETGLPLLLDGAQALGAVPVDVTAIGCDFYAAAGQKWLCGPDGTGMLFAPARVTDALGVPWPSFMSIVDHERPLDLVPNTGARRLDAKLLAGSEAAAALAAVNTLEEAGWGWLHARGRALAATLRSLLAERRDVVDGGPTTLVSWPDPDPEGAVERLAAEGVIVRAIPGRPWVRASVGAWNDEADLERLAASA